MSGTVSIAVVASGTNGDGAAVSGEGDAGSGVVVSGFSIDVSAELLPGVGCRVALVDAHMSGIEAIAAVVSGPNGNEAAVSGERDASSKLIVRIFCIDVSAELLPGIGCAVALVDAHMSGTVSIGVVASGTNGDGAAVSGEGDAGSG